MSDIKLSFLPVGSAFAFTFGDSLLRLQDESGEFPVLFRTREEAVNAAESCGLRVTDSDSVVTLQQYPVLLAEVRK